MMQLAHRVLALIGDPALHDVPPADTRDWLACSAGQPPARNRGC